MDIKAGDGHRVIPEDLGDRLEPATDLLLIRTDYERYRSEDRYWQRKSVRRLPNRN